MVSPMSRLREQRIDRYLALAACAGAGGIATTGADAAIVYSDPLWFATASVSGTIPAGDSITNFGPGATLLDGKFGLTALVARSYTTNSRFIAFNPLGAGAQVRGSRLISGDAVGSHPAWLGGGTNLLGSDSKGGGFVGYAAPWQLGVGTVGNSLSGFVGFRFTTVAGTFYGYFEITVSRTGTDSSSGISLTVHRWAYNDEAGASIIIGPPTVIPGGAGLAALAFGAAGLRGRRRSRN